MNKINQLKEEIEFLREQNKLLREAYTRKCQEIAGIRESNNGSFYRKREPEEEHGPFCQCRMCC